MKVATRFAAQSVLLFASARWNQSFVQQPSQPDKCQVNRSGSVPIFQVTVVARATKAINYRQLGGSTELGFQACL